MLSDTLKPSQLQIAVIYWTKSTFFSPPSSKIRCSQTQYVSSNNTIKSTPLLTGCLEEKKCEPGGFTLVVPASSRVTHFKATLDGLSTSKRLFHNRIFSSTTRRREVLLCVLSSLASEESDKQGSKLMQFYTRPAGYSKTLTVELENRIGRRKTNSVALFAR